MHEIHRAHRSLPDPADLDAPHIVHHVATPLTREKLLVELLRENADHRDTPLLVVVHEQPSDLGDDGERATSIAYLTELGLDTDGRVHLVVDWPTGSYPG